jgi:uncharacterized protein
MPGLDLWTILLCLGAGLACGFLNTAASSGSAVSLPVLIMVGLDPAAANATNRIPVLIGALSATASFEAKRVLPWRSAIEVGVPATLGSLAGAALTLLVPARSLGLVITAAVLLALVLLLTNLKRAIEGAEVAETPRNGAREVAAFFAIGIWLGFIVLDGATYLLLALTLLVGLDLLRANAVKSAVLVPVTVVAILFFAWRAQIDWTLAALLGLGSVAGGMLGAHFATSPDAKRHVFRLLVLVIAAELVHLAWHYLFETHR